MLAGFSANPEIKKRNLMRTADRLTQFHQTVASCCLNEDGCTCGSLVDIHSLGIGLVGSSSNPTYSSHDKVQFRGQDCG